MLSHHPDHFRGLSCYCAARAFSFTSFASATSKSFTIRTSKTPLPQPLYNPHLQAPLGSAGNKGLITPLESALTKNPPVSRLESALTKTGGWGVLPAVQTILFRWKIPPAETASAPRAERPRWHRVGGNAGAAVREL